MADAKTEKQKVKKITDKPEEGLKELFESEKYKSYLSTMSKFHNYSFNNTLLIALQRNVDKHKNFVKYEDLTLGMLLGALPRSVKKRYLERTISELDGEDIHFLKIYYSANLSIQRTAAQLFLHKNTVQYRLNRINKITGLNPRVFEDAVVLYLALSLQ